MQEECIISLMEKLVLDGKVFVKASSAADELGYTRDYIGQLCRAGTVQAHLVGRSWYVNQEQLQLHKKEKRRLTKVKAREQVQRSIQAAQEANSKEKAYESRIKYESDDEELIPEIKKLSVDEERIVQKRSPEKGKKKGKKDEPDYTIENKGEKTVMSGTLSVVDASEEDATFDENATVLHAKIVEGKPDAHKRSQKKRFIKETKAISVTEEDGEEEEPVAVDSGGSEKTSFRKKLALLEEENALQKERTRENRRRKKETPTYHSKQQTDSEEKVSSGAKWPVYVLILVCLFIAAGSVTLESRWVLGATGGGQETSPVFTDYIVDIQDVLAYLKTLINRQ